MGRALPTGEDVGRPRVEREARAPVVADDPGPRLQDPRTEPVVEALDEGHSVAVGVGRDEGDRVSARPDRTAGWVGLGRVGSSLIADGRDVALVEERAHRDARDPGVGVVAVPVRRGHSEHLSDEGGVGSERVRVHLQPLDGREDLEEDEPLRVRRRHADVEVAVPGRERRGQLRPVEHKVAEGHRRAQRSEPLDEPPADLAAVQRPRTLVRDGPQRGGQGGLDQEVPLGERASSGEEHGGHPGISREDLRSLREGGGQRAGNDDAALGEPDRRLERGGEPLRRAQPGQGGPPGDGAGHRDGRRPSLRHGRSGPAEGVGGDGHGGRAARVHRRDLPVRLLDQGEEVSAHAVSLVQSLYNGFGSGILEPGTGIVCHNRGACFSLDPGSPNVLA
ncbi:MAG: gamma-glutamyltransferase, partial [Actinobacteria bacterium]|nr:gamma-glutamyltransferase [Actinomycetota bacterium]